MEFGQCYPYILWEWTLLSGDSWLTSLERELQSIFEIVSVIICVADIEGDFFLKIVC